MSSMTLPENRAEASSAMPAPESTAPAPAAPKLHEIPRRSPFGALLSRTLPKYGGPHDVGVCDIEVPVERRTFGTFVHKEMHEKAAGLTLDTVLFTLFYPCEHQENPSPVVWFPACVLFSSRTDAV
jgi:platelet-activating factor acetylhydrolase